MILRIVLNFKKLRENISYYETVYPRGKFSTKY